MHKVTLAADDEATSSDEHTRRGRLGDLIGVHPVDLSCHLVFPTRAVAHFKRGRFEQG